MPDPSQYYHSSYTMSSLNDGRMLHAHASDRLLEAIIQMHMRRGALLDMWRMFHVILVILTVHNFTQSHLTIRGQRIDTDNLNIRLDALFTKLDIMRIQLSILDPKSEAAN